MAGLPEVVIATVPVLLGQYARHAVRLVIRFLIARTKRPAMRKSPLGITVRQRQRQPQRARTSPNVSWRPCSSPWQQRQPPLKPESSSQTGDFFPLTEVSPDCAAVCASPGFLCLGAAHLVQMAFAQIGGGDF